MHFGGQEKTLLLDTRLSESGEVDLLKWNCHLLWYLPIKGFYAFPMSDLCEGHRGTRCFRSSAGRMTKSLLENVFPRS